MILRRMRYFATVAREGGVARAATELRIAQPALSRQIQKLEQMLGVSLFERGRRGVQLTGPGILLLRRVGDLGALMDRAVTRTRMAGAGQLGTVRLGLARAALHSRRIGRGLAAMRERYPEIELTIREVSSTAQSSALLRGDLDLAIGVHGSAEESRLDHLVLYEETVDCVTLPASHTLARAREIEPAQLRGERLHLLDPAIASGIPELYDALRHLGFRVWQAHETWDALFTLVAAGLGWTVGLRSFMEQPPIGTAVVPMRGLSVPMDLAVRWRAKGALPLTVNVAELLRRHCGRENEITSVDRRRRPRAVRVPGTDAAKAEIQLRHLRALVTAAALGSLSRAAERLRVTQSGLSRQIASLEREIGTPLVERRASGIALTAAGSVLNSEAEGVLAFVDELMDDVHNVDRGVPGRCRIGAIPAELAGDTIVAALNRASELCPEVVIEVREMLSPQQGDALRSGEIDLGVAGAFPGVNDDPNIATLRIVDDVVDCALLSASHPLATKAQLKITDLASFPFVFVSRSTYPNLYDRVMEAFENLDFVPRFHGGVNGARAIWRIVADSESWTLGTRAMQTGAPAGLVAIPVEGFTIPTGVHLLWRRHERDATVRAVVDLFRAS